MSDIVERLRAALGGADYRLLIEAAAEIERLCSDLNSTADQLQWTEDELGRKEAEIARLKALAHDNHGTIQTLGFEIERLRGRAQWNDEMMRELNRLRDLTRSQSRKLERKEAFSR